MKAVLVTGGREYSDLQRVISELGDEMPALVIHGCATGADGLASRYAVLNFRAEARFPADWQLHGRAAGPLRNERMVRFAADLESAGWDVVVVAFPGGRGTANCVQMAERVGLTVREVR